MLKCLKHIMSKEVLIRNFENRGWVIPSLMIDHIDMVIGDFLIYGTAQDVGEFFEKLNQVDVVTHEGECIEFFNKAKKAYPL